MRKFDYKCIRCGHVFEHTYESGENLESFIQCTGCGQYTAEHVWITPPAMSPDPYWAGHVDPDVGYVTSRTELHDKMETAGMRFKEPGSDRDAENNGKNYLERKRQERRKKIKDWIGGHDIGELNRKIALERSIQPGQQFAVNSNIEQESYIPGDYFPEDQDYNGNK